MSQDIEAVKSKSFWDGALACLTMIALAFIVLCVVVQIYDSGKKAGEAKNRLPVVENPKSPQ